MGQFKFSPGHCGEGDCGCGDLVECTPSFLVTICDAPIEGATVKIWDSSAKTTLMGSGTSDASGNAYVSINVPSGVTTTWYWEASYPSVRTGVASGTSQCDEEGTPDFTIDAAIPPAAGYQCGVWCQLPLANTLYYHDDVLGDVTLTATGSGGWSGTVSHTFSSGTDAYTNTCGGPTVDVTVTAGAAAVAGSVSVGMPRGGALGASTCIKCVLSSGSDTFCQATVTVEGCPDGDAFSLSFTYSAVVLNPTSPASVSGTLTE